MGTGKLLGIAIRGKSRAPMTEVVSAQITKEKGVGGDFRGVSSSRQVTILSREAWTAACAEMGEWPPWTTRRANLLVEGLNLANTINAIIRIGDVQLQVTGETDPCGRMDEQVPGLREALTSNWRGGVCCRVIAPGSVAVGDKVLLNGPEPIVDVATRPIT